MTLADVTAKMRREGCPHADHDFCLSKFADALEADPDFKLRERIEAVVSRMANAHPDDVSALTFYQWARDALGPSPGPTLRERVEVLAEWYDQSWGREHHLDTGARIAERLRGLLNPPKGGA